MTAAEAKQAALEVGDLVWQHAKSSLRATADLHWQAMKWNAGMLGGEFTQKRTVGQIVADAVISMFPVAGEITAARDSIAITLRLCHDPKARDNKWEWVSLLLCLLAVVPVLGGLLKGVGKLLIRAVDRSEDLAKLAQGILAFVRKMGYGDPMAWLKTLDFSKYLGVVNQAFHELLTRIGNAIQFIVKHMSAVLPAPLLTHLNALPSKLEMLRPLGVHKFLQATKDLNDLLNRLRQHLIDGTWTDITVSAGSGRLMTEEARLAELARDMGTSLGHAAATKVHYTHKDGWSDLRAIQETHGIGTFSVKATIEAFTATPGTAMVRVIDTAELGNAWTIPGRFWTTHLPPNGTAWRMQCAVPHEWNMNGSYVMMKVPTREELDALKIPVPTDWKGMRVWKGQIAEQLDNDGKNATGRLLAGGDVQFFVDFSNPHNAPILAWIKLEVTAWRTYWNDVLLPNEKQAKALLLAERERSAKSRQEGYSLRGAATVSKPETTESQ